MSTPYELVGSADVVRALVDHFYDEMDRRPDVVELRRMHAGELGPMRDKLFAFLSGWLGGPQLYVEQYGHPRLRARHLPFAIDADARDQWMRCMEAAFEATPMEPGLRAELLASIERLATHMINRG